MHWIERLLAELAFWSMRTCVKHRLRQRWWDSYDTWTVLTDLAEELSGCKCLETQWADGKITRTLPRP